MMTYNFQPVGPIVAEISARPIEGYNLGIASATTLIRDLADQMAAIPEANPDIAAALHVAANCVAALRVEGGN